MIRLIENLCAINGVSGDEQDVAAAIIEQIKDYCEYEVTPLGDVIAFKKGAKHPRNRVMFDAHMDEVGFIITYITEEGVLRFATVGGIDNRVIQGKTGGGRQKQGLWHHQLQTHSSDRPGPPG